MARKKKEESEDMDTEVSEEKVREEALKELFKSANKNLGAGILYTSDEHKFKLRRISTGIVPLDYALGGGLPVGRVSLFFGMKSTAKTTNILRSIGNAQKLCSACWTDKTNGCECGKNRKVVIAWLDVEGVWDEEWSRRFLTIDENLLLSQPSSAEQAIDLAHAALKSLVDILVIDSLAFMTPQTEQDKSSAEHTIGLQARLLGNFTRKMVSVQNELGREYGYRPTIILTNQIRQKVGVLYGSPNTVSGGLAPGFSTSVEIETKAGKYEMDDATLRPLLVENKAKITKNKTFLPQIEAEWKVSLCKLDNKGVGDIIDEDWSVSMAEKAGLITVAPQNVVWGEHKFRGVSLLEKFLRDHPEEYLKFKNELMPKILVV